MFRNDPQVKFRQWMDSSRKTQEEARGILQSQGKKAKSKAQDTQDAPKEELRRGLERRSVDTY